MQIRTPGLDGQTHACAAAFTSKLTAMSHGRQVALKVTETRRNPSRRGTFMQHGSRPLWRPIAGTRHQSTPNTGSRPDVEVATAHGRTEAVTLKGGTCVIAVASTVESGLMTAGVPSGGARTDSGHCSWNSDAASWQTVMLSAATCGHQGLNICQEARDDRTLDSCC